MCVTHNLNTYDVKSGHSKLKQSASLSLEPSLSNVCQSI